MSNFREIRNIEISTIQYLQTAINASWAGITVVKGFKQATETSLPVVCVRAFDITPRRKEIGNSDYKYIINILIDIFATNDGQRLDLVHTICEALKTTWTYNEYSKDSGDVETITGTPNGKLRNIEFIQNSRIDFGENVESRDRFRHFISVNIGKP